MLDIYRDPKVYTADDYKIPDSFYRWRAANPTACIAQVIVDREVPIDPQDSANAPPSAARTARLPDL